MLDPNEFISIISFVILISKMHAPQTDMNSLRGAKIKNVEVLF